jgi:hypothetical protein
MNVQIELNKHELSHSDVGEKTSQVGLKPPPCAPCWLAKRLLRLQFSGISGALAKLLSSGIGLGCTCGRLSGTSVATSPPQTFKSHLQSAVPLLELQLVASKPGIDVISVCCWQLRQESNFCRCRDVKLVPLGLAMTTWPFWTITAGE